MKEELYTAYCPERDMTFIMKVEYDGNLKVESVVGYYDGPPGDESTKQFYGDLVGIFLS